MFTLGWAAWVIFVVVFLWSGYSFRESIVKAWPPSTRLYEFIGLLDARDLGEPSSNSRFGGVLSIRNQARPRANPDGTFDLLISGTIENTTDEALALPKIVGLLRNAEQLTIHRWTINLSEDSIGPRGRIEFTTEVPSVPLETTEFEILPDWQD